MSSEGEGAFAALPAELLVSVVVRLPVDSRLLAAGVNRHCRAALASPRVWDDLDLCFEGGAAPMTRLHDMACGKADDEHFQHWTDVSMALLRAAARRAPRRLVVQDMFLLLDDEEVMQVLRAPSLRELHVEGDLNPEGVAALLSALPALPLLSVGYVIEVALIDAAQFLDGAAREPRLRLHDLRLITAWDYTGNVPHYVSPQAAAALAAAVLAYPWPLNALVLSVTANEDTGGSLERLITAARQVRVSTLCLFCDGLDAACQAALRALLHDGHVQKLGLWGSLREDEAAAPTETRHLATALRASAALRTLRLIGVTFARSPDDFVCLMEALTGHPTLASLEMQRVPLAGDTRMGAALAALVSADTPALGALHVEDCSLHAVNLTALLCALRRNRHLRELRCTANQHDNMTLEQASAVAAALAAKSTLEVLDLSSTKLADAPGEVSPLAVLLASLVEHPSLRELHIVDTGTATPRAALGLGACLHALVVADTPALKALDVSLNGLRAEGLSLLLRALPHNTHLETLYCSYNTAGCANVDEAFARDVLLPAVRANSSLGRLICGGDELGGAASGSWLPPLPSFVEAMRLVDRRPLWQ